MFTNPRKGKRHRSTETQALPLWRGSEPLLAGPPFPGLVLFLQRGAWRKRNSRITYVPVFSSFLMEMEKNLSIAVCGGVQLGSVCVYTMEGWMSGDGPTGSLTVLFGGPHGTGLQWVRDWRAWLLHQRQVNDLGFPSAVLERSNSPSWTCATGAGILPPPAPPDLLAGAPSLFTIILPNGFWLLKTKGIWSIKLNAFCVMAFLVWVSKIQN